MFDTSAYYKELYQELFPFYTIALVCIQIILEHHLVVEELNTGTWLKWTSQVSQFILLLPCFQSLFLVMCPVDIISVPFSLIY